MEQLKPATSDDLDISGYVRRVRRLADVSQRDLAALLGIDQSTISRVESGSDIRVRAFARILAAAGLRLAVVDETGREPEPMPSDVFLDRAGRRRPAHLDVHALPELPTMKMLLHSVDPAPGGSWHHFRSERDRLRRRTGRSALDEQLTMSAARARRRKPARGRVAT